MQVKRAIAIGRTPGQLYEFWREFRNLPLFMKHLESVDRVGTAAEAVAPDGRAERSHWVVMGPAGSRVEWDAEIVADRPDELIAWRSLQGADVENSGTVHFRPDTGGRGSVVTVEMRFHPPAGALGAAVAKLFGEDPQWQVQDDLRRFKQVMEVGEVLTTEGQPAGRDSSTSSTYDGAVRDSA